MLWGECMKVILLVISVVIGTLLLIVLDQDVLSIVGFVVFGVISIFVLSMLTNYSECTDSIKHVKEEQENE